MSDIKTHQYTSEEAIPFKLLDGEAIAVHTVWQGEEKRFSIIVQHVEVATPSPHDLDLVRSAVVATVDRLAMIVPIEEREALAQ